VYVAVSQLETTNMENLEFLKPEEGDNDTTLKLKEGIGS
jgi:hypothetical protein